MCAAKSKNQKPLSVRHEHFCQHVASGMNATRAYIAAGYQVSDSVAGTNGQRLLQKAAIQARVAELRKETETKLEFTRESFARHLFAAATTPVSQIDENSPLSAEVTIEFIAGGSRGKLRRGNAPSGNETEGETIVRKKVKAMDKGVAARLLLEMMGWREPEQIHQVVDAGPNTLEMVRERAKAMGSPLAKESAPAESPKASEPE